MTSTVLIINGVLADPAPPQRVLVDQVLLIEDGRIVGIGPRSSFPSAGAHIIDARGRLVLPGFINAHTHLYSTFACGLSGVEHSTDFLEVLKHLWWRLDKALTVDDCYQSAMPALLASIRSGTTTLIDHHASPNAIRGSLDVVARAVAQTGLRACLCYEVSDRDGQTKTEEGIQENRAFLQQCKDSPDDLLRGLFGLHASFTLSGETLEAAAEVIRETQTGVHVHVAESTADQRITAEKYGKRAVERLHHFGLLSPDSVVAHCVHISDAEAHLLASTGTMMVHNPQSNLNNAVGIADLAACFRHAITVGLGTDAMTTNMREELRAGVWSQRHGRQNPSAGFAELTSALWTGNPAIASRIWGEAVGTLREGALADIIIVDYKPPTPLTDESLLGHLVFGMMNGCVDTTIVGGNILMENRELNIDIDEEEVMAHAREAAARVWKRF